MLISPEHLAFVESHQSAAMITIGTDGTPKAARVGLAVVDGRIWSSGTRDRVRTDRLRRDPRCTLYVHDAAFAWVALETTVSILEGPDVGAQSVALFRMMQRKPTGPLSWFGGEHEEDDFVKVLEAEGRLIYEFEVTKSYGLIG